MFFFSVIVVYNVKTRRAGTESALPWIFLRFINDQTQPCLTVMQGSPEAHIYDLSDPQLLSEFRKPHLGLGRLNEWFRWFSHNELNEIGDSVSITTHKQFSFFNWNCVLQSQFFNWNLIWRQDFSFKTKLA